MNSVTTERRARIKHPRLLASFLSFFLGISMLLVGSGCGDGEERSSDSTEHDSTEHDSTEHDSTEHDSTEHDSTEHDSTEHDSTEHDSTEHDSTEHDSTEHDSTEHDSTEHDSTEHDSTPEDSSAPQVGTFLKADVERDRTPSDENVGELVAGLGDFSLDLLRILYAQDPTDNLVFSPLSLYFPLLQVRAGAVGETAAEMDSALRLRLQDEALHEAMNALLLEMSGGVGPDGALRIANVLWMQEDLNVRSSWLELLARHYDSGIHLVDFGNDGLHERIVDAINTSVREETDGLIERILNAQHITPRTQLLIVNTLYLSSQWSRPLNRRQIPAPFFAANGEVLPGPVLSDEQHGLWAFDGEDGSQAISLPLVDVPVDIVAVLPPAEDEANWFASLDGDWFDDLRASLTRVYGTLQLPVLDLRASTPVGDLLRDDFGMQRAFVLGGAEFDGISHDVPSLNNVRHEAAFAMDEDGVTAAAATMVSGEAQVSGSPPTFSFVADRPFLIFAVHRDTGAILMLVRVAHP